MGAPKSASSGALPILLRLFLESELMAGDLEFILSSDINESNKIDLKSLIIQELLIISKWKE